MIIYEIEGPIETLHILKDPLKIGNCSIIQKDGKMWIHSIGESDDKLKAKEIALKRIRKACLCWSLIFNNQLIFNESNSRSSIIEQHDKLIVKRQGLSMIISDAAISCEVKPEEINSLLALSKVFENADEYSLKAANYFERGLASKSKPDHSFLNFYKASELISNKLFKENIAEKTKKSNKPKQKITATEKMIYMCEVLGIDNSIVNKLVDIRNRGFDVGHAQVRIVQVEKEDLNNCMNLTKEVILKYCSIGKTKKL